MMEERTEAAHRRQEDQPKGGGGALGHEVEVSEGRQPRPAELEHQLQTMAPREAEGGRGSALHAASQGQAVLYMQRRRDRECLSREGSRGARQKAMCFSSLSLQLD